VTTEGAAVVLESQGIHTPDRSHPAGVGWTPDGEDTSETKREKPGCHRLSLCLSLSRPRDDMLFLCALFFPSRWDFEQIVFTEGESKGASLLPYRSLKAYREVGESSIPNPDCSARNQSVCRVITSKFLKCF
jgi:hypothetical protein